MGIITGADLRTRSLDDLRTAFGKAADYYHGAAWGRDERPVRPDRVLKSVGAERTFDRDIADPAALGAALEPVIDAAMVRIDRSGTRGRTVTLKLRYADFRTVTRARSFPAATGARADIAAAAHALLAGLTPVPLGVRLLGVTLSALEDGEAAQLGLL